MKFPRSNLRCIHPFMVVFLMTALATGCAAFTLPPSGSIASGDTVAPSPVNATDREAEFKRKLESLSSSRAPFKSSKTDPSEFIREMEAHLNALKLLSAEYSDLPDAKKMGGVIQQGYTALGDISRFALNQSKQAVVFYRQAVNANDDQGDVAELVARISLADAYRYGLNDPNKALVQYQRALKRIRAGISSPDGKKQRAAYRWMRRWIDQEIDYLKRGDVFEGRITARDVTEFKTGVRLFHTADRLRRHVSLNTGLDPQARSDAVNIPKIALAMPTLPRSQRILIHTLAELSYLPDPAAVLAHLKIQDPAGYMTAVILAAALHQETEAKSGAAASNPVLPGAVKGPSGKPSAIRQAAELYLRESPVRFEFWVDPRFISPERTWSHFLESLKQGDVGEVLSCFSAPLRDKLVALFSSMGKKKMAALADDLKDIEGTRGQAAMAELKAIRDVLGESQTGGVSFTQENGEWKIQAL